MYQKNSRPGNRGDNNFKRRKRNSGSKKSYHSGSTRTGSSFFFTQNRNNSNRRKANNREDNIDHSRYIKKASLAQDLTPYKTRHQFNDFELLDILKKNIKDMQYISPMPIQDQAIPHILNGRDVIGTANTGMGKTAAFLIPLINKLAKDPNQKVLIVAPTRELAGQINEELRKFSKSMNLFSVLCIGGAPIGKQIFGLSRKYHFIIGTPGRLVDLIDRKKIFLQQIQNIVLDEVDRMVDMGFINDIKKIVSLLSEKRQSLFFSATVPPKINSLIKTFLTDPITVSVKVGETADNIEQDIVTFETQTGKIEVLHNLLNKKELEKVLIFDRTKRGAEALSKELVNRGFRATSIHGNKTQSNREKALRQFRNAELQILVATDVAARGLDINGVTHVINYNIPESYNDYIHRIGRVGRANKKGVALTFVK